MKIAIDPTQRYAKMRAHTATHLLHAALEKILGQTKQEGSLVDEDYLRFDFAIKQSLSPEQLHEIEQIINHQIHSALPVQIQEMSLEESRDLGAKMFFGDKYGERVRVVRIGDGVSVELCGGTHTPNTKDIGAFAIISQEAVSSGVKRITAYTGPKVSAYLHEKQQLIYDIMTAVGVTGESQLLPKISKILSESKEQTAIIESLKAKLVGGVLQSIELIPQGPLDGVVSLDNHPDLLGLKIKTIANEARIIYQNKTVLLYDQEGTFALLAQGDVSARDLAKKIGLRGGGSDDLVQGRDADIELKIG